MALEGSLIRLMLDHQAHREDDVPKADRDALAREKDTLVRTFEIAVMDIGDRRVRDRLTGCATVWMVGALNPVADYARSPVPSPKRWRRKPVRPVDTDPTSLTSGKS